MPTRPYESMIPPSATGSGLRRGTVDSPRFRVTSQSKGGRKGGENRSKRGRFGVEKGTLFYTPKNDNPPTPNDLHATARIERLFFHPATRRRDKEFPVPCRSSASSFDL
jgi:hypothetical protein